MKIFLIYFGNSLDIYTIYNYIRSKERRETVTVGEIISCVCAVVQTICTELVYRLLYRTRSQQKKNRHQAPRKTQTEAVMERGKGRTPRVPSILIVSDRDEKIKLVFYIVDRVNRYYDRIIIMPVRYNPCSHIRMRHDCINLCADAAHQSSKGGSVNGLSVCYPILPKV